MNQGYQEYEIKNWLNESVEDMFSPSELQKVPINEDTKYAMEKFLKQKCGSGEQQTTGGAGATRSIWSGI